MNRVITAGLLMTLLVSSVALAADDVTRLGLGIEPSPNPNVPTEAPDSPADVFIASSTNGGVFTDLSPYYGSAFVAAGAASTTAIQDAADSPFVFPVPFTAAQYGTLCVLSNENWWGPAGNGAPQANVSLTDEAAIAAYLDTGGTMLFSGQDYLYGRGNGGGFPATRLGVASYIDDINFNDDNIAWGGVAGSPLDGLFGTLNAVHETPPCWATQNLFYSDDVTPSQLGIIDYASFPSGAVGQAGSTYAAGNYRVVFTTVDLACTTNQQGEFYPAVAAIYNYLVGGATPVEPSSWGALKNRYKD
jgi:hypothetical protein